MQVTVSMRGGTLLAVTCIEVRNNAHPIIGRKGVCERSQTITWRDGLDFIVLWPYLSDLCKMTSNLCKMRLYTIAVNEEIVLNSKGLSSRHLSRDVITS